MADAENLGLIVAQIRNSFSDSMSQVAGEFRQASRDSNINLNRIVKDIANIFKSQRQDIADLQNSMNDVATETQEMSSRIDRLGSYMQDLISVETNILGSIRDMGKGISILNDSTESLNENMKDSLGERGVLGAITNGVSELSLGLWELTKMGIGAGAAAGAGYLYNQSQQSEGAGGQYNASQAASLIRKVGGTEEEATILGAISQPESKGNPKARLTTSKEDSLGLWQINMMPKYEEERLRMFGLQNKYQLFDPETNARAALTLLRKRGNYNDWSTYKDGKYKQYLSSASGGARGKIGDNTTPSTTPSDTTRNSDATPVASSPTTPGNERMEGASPLPSGDLVALGKALQGMGIRVSEHPAFGGVHPEQHHPGSAHNDGMAMDINAPGNIIEARDPVWGPKFDKLAKQLQAAGYTVLWRVKDHDNHIHAQIGGKGIKGGRSAVGGQGGASPDQGYNEAANRSTLTPTSAPMGTPMTVPASATSERTETPASTAISRPMEAPQSNIPNQMLLGALSSFLPGGLGGIVGSFLPMITGALGSMDMGGLAPQMAMGPTGGPGELLNSLSLPQLNSQIVKQSAVQSAANEQLYQESLTEPQPTNLTPEARSSQQPYIGNMEGYNYNNPADVGWPDWAALIGGNHWDEMKKIKKTMWG